MLSTKSLIVASALVCAASPAMAKSQHEHHSGTKAKASKAAPAAKKSPSEAQAESSQANKTAPESNSAAAESHAQESSQGTAGNTQPQQNPASLQNSSATH